MTEQQEATTRRSILAAGAVGGVGVVLAACGSGGSGGGDGYGAGGSGDSGGSGEGGGAAEAPASGTKLAALDDIPVGGAKAVQADGKPVILTRPEDKKVVAFSGVCTHKGCTVEPAGKEFKCPCHGSTFDAATGKPTQGPASEPLAAVEVRVDGSSVLTGKA